MQLERNTLTQRPCREPFIRQYDPGLILRQSSKVQSCIVQSCLMILVSLSERICDLKDDGLVRLTICKKSGGGDG
jgi:hypothetical protein